LQVGKLTLDPGPTLNHAKNSDPHTRARNGERDEHEALENPPES